MHKFNDFFYLNFKYFEFDGLCSLKIFLTINNSHQVIISERKGSFEQEI